MNQYSASFMYALVLLLAVLFTIEARHTDHRTSSDLDDASYETEMDRTGANSRSRSGSYRRNDDTQPGQYTNCSQCSANSANNRDSKKNYRIESIKADILRKLHLRAPPNITGRQVPSLPHIQQYIDKLSHQYPEVLDYEYADAEVDDERATTMKVIQLCKPVPQNKILHPATSGNVCYLNFPMSEISSLSQIVHLTFGVYVKSVEYEPNGPHRSSGLFVYMLGPGLKRKIISKHISLNSEGTGRWYTLRIPAITIQNWLTDSNSNYGLLIQSSNGRGDPIAVVTPSNEEEEAYRPYIEIETRDERAPRTKRSTDLNCDERSSEKRCCRYPLEVDFASFKWDWIIVPTRYSAYYCSGECPYLFVQQHANTYVSQLARPNGSGGPCCSPRKVSAISMLYYDQNMNIVYGRLPGMVVDRCGCS